MVKPIALLACCVCLSGCLATGFSNESTATTPNGIVRTSKSSAFYRNVSGSGAAAAMDAGGDLLTKITESPLMLLAGGGIFGGALGKSQGRHAGWDEAANDSKLAQRDALLKASPGVLV